MCWNTHFQRVGILTPNVLEFSHFQCVWGILTPNVFEEYSLPMCWSFLTSNVLGILTPNEKEYSLPHALPMCWSFLTSNVLEEYSLPMCWSFLTSNVWEEYSLPMCWITHFQCVGILTSNMLEYSLPMCWKIQNVISCLLPTCKIFPGNKLQNSSALRKFQDKGLNSDMLEILSHLKIPTCWSNKTRADVLIGLKWRKHSWLSFENFQNRFQQIQSSGIGEGILGWIWDTFCDVFDQFSGNSSQSAVRRKT